MGGEIGVQSVPDEGSTFWFTARLQKQRAGLPVAPVAVPARLQGLRVLIVDDNATNRTILEHQTLSWGMAPTGVADGPSALALLRTAAANGAPYDLALLDMHMPGMDGLHLASAITADPTLGAIRLILLTSGGVTATAAEMQQAGIHVCVTKPVRQARLFDCLTTVMAQPTTPVHRATPAPSLAAAPSGPMRQGDMALHILLAEDNPINQQVAAQMLRKQGCHVDVVATGREAVVALSTEQNPPYAMVFMDCQMPEMDGYAATAAIRAHEGAQRHTPIIAMTANVLAGDREACLAAGMDDYLAKPVTSASLAVAVERWARSTAAPSLPARPGNPEAPSHADALDPAMLDALRSLQQVGEPDLLSQVSALFVAGAERHLQTLRDAMAHGDAQALAWEAHTLKGSCASLGARSMAGLCADLEARARAGNLTGVAVVMDQLATEFTRVRAALHARELA